MMARRLFAVVALLIAGGCFATPGDAAARLQHWLALLPTELPAGSTKAEVEAFFSRNGMESVSPTERSIIAFERGIQTSGMVTTDIRFRCQLDASQRLESPCTASMVHTGP